MPILEIEHSAVTSFQSLWMKLWEVSSKWIQYKYFFTFLNPKYYVDEEMIRAIVEENLQKRVPDHVNQIFFEKYILLSLAEESQFWRLFGNSPKHSQEFQRKYFWLSFETLW